MKKESRDSHRLRRALLLILALSLFTVGALGFSAGVVGALFWNSLDFIGEHGVEILTAREAVAMCARAFGLGIAAVYAGVLVLRRSRRPLEGA